MHWCVRGAGGMRGIVKLYNIKFMLPCWIKHLETFISHFVVGDGGGGVDITYQCMFLVPTPIFLPVRITRRQMGDGVCGCVGAWVQGWVCMGEWVQSV